MAALRIFADKGFKGASTREICQLANVNLSAIPYYFGSKAGLYKATFTETVCYEPSQTKLATYTSLPLAGALELFFQDFLDPLKNKEEVKLVMKLHYREMIESSGIYQNGVDEHTLQEYQDLLSFLKLHIGLKRIDADLQHLAFSIFSLGVGYYVGYEMVTFVSPNLLNSPNAIDTLAKRLGEFAFAMVQYEIQRREAEL